jgi:hypothetical protein
LQELLPWSIFPGAEQDATSVNHGGAVYEFVHDGRICSAFRAIEVALMVQRLLLAEMLSGLVVAMFAFSYATVSAEPTIERAISPKEGGRRRPQYLMKRDRRMQGIVAHGVPND